MTDKNNAASLVDAKETAFVVSDFSDFTIDDKPQLDLSRFPAELKKQTIWCGWRYEIVKGKETKVPYRDLVRKADPSDPKKWSTFDACVANYNAAGSTLDGVGVFVTPGRVWTDIDKCALGGIIEPWAQERIIEPLNTYTEFSPSGEGIHCYSLGDIDGPGKKINGIEIYSKARFFTVTGKQVPGTPNELHASPQLHQIRTDLVANKLRPYDIKGDVAPAATIATDEYRPLIAKASADFERLKSGDWNGYESQSEAELAFVNIAMTICQGSVEAADSMYRESGLFRAKWDENDYYRNNTLRLAKESYDKKNPVIDPTSWRSLFHTYDETIHAPQPTFAINDFSQEQGITFFGGLAGSLKTYAMLDMTRAMLTGELLFNCPQFYVKDRSRRILYLVPESSLGAFAFRLKLFHLEKFVGDRLFYRTLSAKDRVEGLLTDPRILRAAEGADVFLDTAVRFMDGEENAASDNRKFADILFGLLAAGARTITGAHHSPKAFSLANGNDMTLENAFRGGGDIGAMLATAWAVRVIDPDKSRIYVKNVKARDFLSPKPFEVEGRPWIDELGRLQIVAQPGMAAPPKKAPRPASNLMEMARGLRSEGKTLEQIAEATGKCLRTVKYWSADGKLGAESAIDSGVA